jgi:hypothetical protein
MSATDAPVLMTRSQYARVAEPFWLFAIFASEICLLSGARAVLPMAVAPEPMVGCLQASIGSRHCVASAWIKLIFDHMTRSHEIEELDDPLPWVSTRSFMSVDSNFCFHGLTPEN